MGIAATDLQDIRTQICHRFLVGISILGVPATVISLLRVLQTGWIPVMTSLCIYISLIVAMTVARKHLPYRITAGFVVLILVLLGLTGLYQMGLLSAAIFFLVEAPLMATLFFGTKWGAAVLVGTALLTAAIAAIASSPSAVPAVDPLAYLRNPFSWLSMIVTHLAVGGSLLYAFHGYSGALIQALQNAQEGEASLRAALAEKEMAVSRVLQTQKVAMIALADVAEYRDNDTGDHVQRVGRLSHEMARHMHRLGIEPESLDIDFLRNISLASVLHDVGKVTVPDSILFKPGRLTSEERRIMERHAPTGARILSKAVHMLPDSPHFKMASIIANYHHEHWDGSGYPERLRGADIPLSARIVAICDVYDALVSRRPYKEPWPEDMARAYIRERSGSQFDPAAVDAFFETLERRERSERLVWKEAYSTGFAAIDGDHRIILRLLNQLSNPDDPADQISIGFTLEELSDYASYHFVREEQLMEKADYPGIEGHREAHGEFLKQALILQHGFIGQRHSVNRELAAFLETWFNSHILKIDMDYRPSVLEWEKCSRAKA